MLETYFIICSASSLLVSFSDLSKTNAIIVVQSSGKGHFGIFGILNSGGCFSIKAVDQVVKANWSNIKIRQIIKGEDNINIVVL